MNSKSLVFLSVVALFFACSKAEKETIVKVKVMKMTEEEIYNKDLAYDVIFDSEELNIDSLKNKSSKIFLQGVDAFKNKKNPKDAIEFFKSSIVVYPQAKTYYELGNALMALKQGLNDNLKEAIQAFGVAEHLNFQPISKVNYNSAVANYMLADLNNSEEDDYYYSALSFLRRAFYNGFSDTLIINNDPRINSITSRDSYKMMITSIAAEKLKDNSNALFDLFIKSFPNRPLPFDIPVDEVDMGGYKESISYDFAEFIPEMENTSFGREVSHDYFYVAKLVDNPAYKAIVYTSVSFYGEEMQPTTTNLVTYNSKGKIISRKMIACQCSAEKVKIALIDKDVVTVEDHKRIWEQPIDAVSFNENKVKEYELITQAKFKIDDMGQILDFDVPANYSDSIIFAKNF